MWNYEKRLQYPVKINHKNKPKDRTSYNITIRWSRWRVGCIYEIFVSKIYDAV